MRGYNKYIVICRPLTCGKIVYRQTDEGLDKMYIGKDGRNRWNHWGERSRWRQTWTNEALNPDSQEYEEDIIIDSFTKLDDAISFMENTPIIKQPAT